MKEQPFLEALEDLIDRYVKAGADRDDMVADLQQAADLLEEEAANAAQDND